MLDGRQVTLTTPHQAQRLGISIIYQEFNLFPNLSVEENVFIGREPNASGVVDWRDTASGDARIARPLGVHLDPGTPVRDLSVAQQQMVEIAKALSFNAEYRDHGRADLGPDRYRGGGAFRRSFAG